MDEAMEFRKDGGEKKGEGSVPFPSSAVQSNSVLVRGASQLLKGCWTLRQGRRKDNWKLSLSCIAVDDSTAAAMIRTIYLLLLHPNAMKKVQEELDHHVGKERTVNESDLGNLVCLQAVIKESLRLGPPTPLLALCVSIKDCHIGGFRVPAGTHLGSTCGRYITTLRVPQPSVI
ncbi:Cytochrome P450 82A1 [Nymphaea thermarum]|nr:Cytochrome P450 82A1 [Nymphaea thermarum]